jgi:curved DNA-binding protein CbpA
MLEEVSAALLQFQGADYFHILGIGKESPAEQIKQAYFTLAKKYHPDKYYFTNNPGLAEKGGQLFTLITQAYQTLSDASQRSRYINSMQLTTGKKQTADALAAPLVSSLNKPLESLRKSHVIKIHGKSAIAAKRFLSGKQAMQRSDFNEALEHLREAVRLEPNVASYQFMLGKILSRIPQRSNEALERFEIAVKQDPENWEYRYALGRFYQQLDQAEKAAIQFREVRRLNPQQHIPSLGNEKESILSRLFRKRTPK